MSTALQNIPEAARALREGFVVAFPTETVYGLGAHACDDSAVAEIYARKGRPQFNPLIIHVADAEAAQHCVQWNAHAELLASKFWPGPLTFVLPRRENSPVSLLASAGLDSLAIRVPSHPVALALLQQSGLPLAAPSANRSGRVSPTTAEHVRAEFGDSLMILDGGACDVGVESTVLDLTHKVPRILRPGAVTVDELMSTLNCDVVHHVATDGDALHSPGMMKSHYAPSVPVRMNAWNVSEKEALLAFGPHVLQGAAHTLNLSAEGNLQQAAANLFAHLRALDDERFTAIAVMPIPNEGLGLAINDRLIRAAA